MLYYHKGSIDHEFTFNELKAGFFEALEKLDKGNKILVIPPDFTRYHSFAGKLTSFSYEYFGDGLIDVLPALGTHTAMTENQIDHMFEGVPKNIFRIHDWRKNVITLGEVPSDVIKNVSENKVDYSMPAQVNKLLVEGGHDLILSIGQVVPHEVIGMANYNKNILVGTGGPEVINKSHFLGAAYGMERIMGRAITPVRQVLNYASDHFTTNLPIIYVLTVVSKNNFGKLVVKGLFVGDDMECFERAAELSLLVNFEMLNKPLDKVVVYLDPSEFKSTWLGNKSIYRTRMAIADAGEVIVLAPGLSEFGEDKQIDQLIRKYGYLTTPEILQLTNENGDLQNNLSAAAHLIHGSSENRFKITYCPGHLSKTEIESVNFHYASLDTMIQKYDPSKLVDGFNVMPDGEEIFYVANPALGLWAYKGRFD
jgi:nickel-dependent lactate racemase